MFVSWVHAVFGGLSGTDPQAGVRAQAEMRDYFKEMFDKRRTDPQDIEVDILTYLLLLPVGMIVGYWVIKRALDGIRSNVVAGRELAAATPAAAGTDAKAADPQDATRQWRAVLLASALRAPAGSDAASVVDAVQANTQPGLTDVQGFGQPIQPPQ